jgi:hypothetical protein
MSWPGEVGPVFPTSSRLDWLSTSSDGGMDPKDLKLISGLTSLEHFYVEDSSLRNRKAEVFIVLGAIRVM